MMSPGEVGSVRELGRGVQARVCLGSDTKLGAAITEVTLNSPEVLAALDALKKIIRSETRGLIGGILEGQARWDKEYLG